MQHLCVVDINVCTHTCTTSENLGIFLSFQIQKKKKKKEFQNQSELIYLIFSEILRLANSFAFQIHSFNHCTFTKRFIARLGDWSQASATFLNFQLFRDATCLLTPFNKNSVNNHKTKITFILLAVTAVAQSL